MDRPRRPREDWLETHGDVLQTQQPVPTTEEPVEEDKTKKKPATKKEE